MNRETDHRSESRLGAALALAGALLLGCVRDTPGYCDSNDSCPSDQRCALPEHACVVGARGCSGNGDCKEDQICNAGACLDAALRGVLSGAQVQPPTCSVATGGVLLALDGNDALIRLSHNVAAATEPTLNAPGAAGRLSPPLQANSAAPTRVPLTADQVAALRAGGFFVSVPSAAFPGGELWAPLRPVGAPEGSLELLALLSGSQESPPSGSTATGNAVVALDDAALRFSVTTSIKTVSAAHIHKGTFNSPGAVLLDLVKYGPPMMNANGTTSLSGSVSRADLPAGLADALRAGQSYVNLHTAAFAGGEISGMLLTYNKALNPRPVARPFQAVMTGRQVPTPQNPIDPSLQGVIQVFLSQDNRALTFRLSHTVTGALLSAHLHRAASAGAPATADPAVCTLGTGTDGVQGTCAVNPGAGGIAELLLSDLTAGRIYADIHPDKGAAAVLGGFLTLPPLQ